MLSSVTTFVMDRRNSSIQIFSKSKDKPNLAKLCAILFLSRCMKLMFRWGCCCNAVLTSSTISPYQASQSSVVVIAFIMVWASPSNCTHGSHSSFANSSARHNAMHYARISCELCFLEVLRQARASPLWSLTMTPIPIV